MLLSSDAKTCQISPLYRELLCLLINRYTFQQSFSWLRKKHIWILLFLDNSIKSFKIYWTRQNIDRMCYSLPHLKMNCPISSYYLTLCILILTVFSFMHYCLYAFSFWLVLISSYIIVIIYPEFNVLDTFSIPLLQIHTQIPSIIMSHQYRTHCLVLRTYYI